MTESPIDPTCLSHGIKWSEHINGKCLYCCICFKPLTPTESYVDKNNIKWDNCVSCGEKIE